MALLGKLRRAGPRSLAMAFLQGSVARCSSPARGGARWFKSVDELRCASGVGAPAPLVCLGACLRRGCLRLDYASLLVPALSTCVGCPCRTTAMRRSPRRPGRPFELGGSEGAISIVVGFSRLNESWTNMGIWQETTSERQLPPRPYHAGVARGCTSSTYVRAGNQGHRDNAHDKQCRMPTKVGREIPMNRLQWGAYMCMARHSRPTSATLVRLF